jgi:hypothetical protein
VIYLSGVDCPDYRALRSEPWAGLLSTPDTRYSASVCLEYGSFALDNACFANPVAFDMGAFLAWADGYPRSALFVTAPDVVGDWTSTLAKSRDAVTRIREIGHKAAVVLQNGATPDTIPDCDAVFVGGSTEWKTSAHAERCVRSFRGWKHMGRVNTVRRLRLAHAWGCDSVDGTFVKFGPRVNCDRLSFRMRSLESQQVFGW